MPHNIQEKYLNLQNVLYLFVTPMWYHLDACATFPPSPTMRLRYKMYHGNRSYLSITRQNFSVVYVLPNPKNWFNDVMNVRNVVEYFFLLLYQARMNNIFCILCRIAFILLITGPSLSYTREKESAESVEKDATVSNEIDTTGPSEKDKADSSEKDTTVSIDDISEHCPDLDKETIEMIKMNKAMV